MEKSHIEWTDNTFNPWWGCMKVSEGCKNCYAETLDHRWKGGHWGPNSPRKLMSDNYWSQPLKWNEAAGKAGIKAKVFCASMADVFENHPDIITSRARLFILIRDTPNLIWQLLTKRPENILKTVPVHWLTQEWPDNVWIGTSVENQAAADLRIPYLIKVPAKVRFLSCEPLLGPVDIAAAYPSYRRIGPKCSSCSGNGYYSDNFKTPCPECKQTGINNKAIHWVICGGESGHGARPIHPDWAAGLRDQCINAGVAFFFKQWGEYLPHCQASIIQQRSPKKFVSPNNPLKENTHYKIGKQASGSVLDGVEYKQFPL